MAEEIKSKGHEKVLDGLLIIVLLTTVLVGNLVMF